MNKKEAINKLKKHRVGFGGNAAVRFDRVVSVINQINEQAKVVVPKVAIDYYEAYKDKLTGFDEWFGDFWDDTFLEEFPQAEQLSEWLYDNDKYTNLQRELALATLIVNGPDAVEIEQEQLYTVEIPDPNADGYSIVLGRKEGKVLIIQTLSTTWEMNCSNQFTEAEIKQDFEWAWDAGFAEPVEVQEVE